MGEKTFSGLINGMGYLHIVVYIKGVFYSYEVLWIGVASCAGVAGGAGGAGGTVFCWFSAVCPSYIEECLIFYAFVARIVK